VQIRPLQQTAFKYSIGDLSENDLPALVDFFNECERLEPMDESITLGEFTDWYHNPMNHSLYLPARLDDDSTVERDTADGGPRGGEGKIIGCIEFTAHPSHTHASGWFYVHPHYRNAGLGRALYAEFERRAKDAGLTSMRITPNREATLLIHFLERRDFELERYFWSMRLPAGQPVEQVVLPQGITVRTFVPNQDEELWAHVRNVTFADHYGSAPRSVEEMTHLSREPYFRPEGLFFAFDGEQIAGFCATGIDPREQERLGLPIGHIHTLGVMPAYRHRGIGRGLLLAGLHYLREFVSIVELGVEGKNERALALYEGVGFHQHRGWANMEKALN
jgi:mycothiol synthase